MVLSIAARFFLGRPECSSSYPWPAHAVMPVSPYCLIIVHKSKSTVQQGRWPQVCVEMTADDAT